MQEMPPLRVIVNHPPTTPVASRFAQGEAGTMVKSELQDGMFYALVVFERDGSMNTLPVNALVHVTTKPQVAPPPPPTEPQPTTKPESEPTDVDAKTTTDAAVPDSEPA